MCGRFTQKLTWRQIHDLYSMRGPSLPLNLQHCHNGAPAQDFQACRLDEDGNRSIAQLRCGLVLAWSKDSRMSTHRINARAETIHTKPLFGDAFRSRRCLVPANGWFEWQRTGHGSSLSSWRSRMDRRCRSPRCGSTGARTENPWSPSPSSRRQPPRPLADIHHRQPAIIDSNRFDDWLDPTSPVPWLLELVREPRAGPYERRPVSTRVNSVQNDDPDILLAVPGRGLF